MDSSKAFTPARLSSWRDSPAKGLPLSFRASGEEADQPTQTSTHTFTTTKSQRQPRRSNLRTPRSSEPEGELTPHGAARTSPTDGGKDRATAEHISHDTVLHLSPSEAKQLHWQTDAVSQPSEQSHQARELQALNIKLTADLADAVSANDMLHKQLHKVQAAMVQSRNDMENAERLALAAESRAAAAEEHAATVQATLERRSAEVAPVCHSIVHAESQVALLACRSIAWMANKACANTGHCCVIRTNSKSGRAWMPCGERLTSGPFQTCTSFCTAECLSSKKKRLHMAAHGAVQHAIFVNLVCSCILCRHTPGSMAMNAVCAFLPAGA